MNDLAEKALLALNVAQAEIRNRPVVSLAVSGFAVSSAIVVAGSRAAAAQATDSITNWFGLLPSSGGASVDNAAGLTTLAGIVVLVLLWIAAVAAMRARRQSEMGVWAVAAAWITPLALGPPLLDTHVYLDVARGVLQRDGLNPYSVTVGQLNHAPIVNAIDSSLRGQPAGTGPLGSLLQHLAIAASGGHVLGAVILLRAVGVVAVVAIGRTAADLAGARRVEALTLTVLNPLLLLYVVSAAHLDGLVAALLLSALVSANQRHWIRAILFATVAGAILPVALVVVLVIAAAHAASRRGGSVWQVAGRDLGEAAVLTVALALVLPHGFSWITTATDQFPDYTPYAPANVIGKILGPVVPGASFDDLAAGGRLTALIAAGCVVVYLLVSVRHRPVDRTAAYALLAAALLAPDVHPWFLIWGIVCLAPTVAGISRTVVVVLSATAVALEPPGFRSAVSVRFGVAAVVVGACALAAAFWREEVEARDRAARAPVSAG